MNQSRRHFIGKMATGTFGVVVPTNMAMAYLSKPNRPKNEWLPHSEKKIRIGIVGGGFGSSFFWHQHPNCTVQAVSDLQPELREKLMKVYQCKQSYNSIEELVKDKNIDAVGVFTDAPSHGRQL